MISCLTSPPSGPASSSSSSPSLLAKSLTLEPPCSPCVHQEMLETDDSQPGASSSSSSPPGAELAGRCGSGREEFPVNDTGPPELPTAAATPPSRRPPLPGPKPQSKRLNQVRLSSFPSGNDVFRLAQFHPSPPICSNRPGRRSRVYGLRTNRSPLPHPADRFRPTPEACGLRPHKATAPPPPPASCP